MNKMFPVFLNMTDKPCLVVGGGKVACRKAGKLLETGARVTLISPEFTGELIELEKAGKAELIYREYRQGDVKGYYLVFACTNDSRINKSIFTDCESFNIMVNIVDKPEVCNFFVPSIASQGDLKIAVSTNGKSCALAKKIRLELEERYDKRYVNLLDFLGKIRDFLKENEPDERIRRKILIDLVFAPDFDRLLEQSGRLDYREYLKTMYKKLNSKKK